MSIVIATGVAEMWQAILAAKPEDGTAFSCPKIGPASHRGGHIKVLARHGGVEVVAKGGPGTPMQIRFLKDIGDYEVREPRKSPGRTPSPARGKAAAPGESVTAVPAGRKRMGGGAEMDGASLSPSFSSLTPAIDGAFARIEAELLGQIASVAETIAAGVARIGSAMTRVSVAAASDDQVAALKHEVGALKDQVAAANRRADDAMSIAGRARVEATRRETPIERAVRMIRTDGSTVTRAPKGGWYVNHAKIARDDAWVIERAKRIGAPAPLLPLKSKSKPEEGAAA